MLTIEQYRNCKVSLNPLWYILYYKKDERYKYISKYLIEFNDYKKINDDIKGDNNESNSK